MAVSSSRFRISPAAATTLRGRPVQLQVSPVDVAEHQAVIGGDRRVGVRHRVARQGGQVLDGLVEQGHRVGAARPDGDPPAIRECLAHLGPSCRQSPPYAHKAYSPPWRTSAQAAISLAARSPSASTVNTRSCRAGSVLPARLANMPFSSTIRSDVLIPARTAPACWARPSSRSSAANRSSRSEPAIEMASGRSRLAAASPAILARKPKNASPGSAASARARASLTRSVDPRRDHRLEQRLLGREVPVDGAGPDPGAGRDLVQRHAVARFGERLPGGAQDLLPVPRRVGSQRPAPSHPPPLAKPSAAAARLSHGC